MTNYKEFGHFEQRLFNKKFKAWHDDKFFNLTKEFAVTSHLLLSFAELSLRHAKKNITRVALKVKMRNHLWQNTPGRRAIE